MTLRVTVKVFSPALFLATHLYVPESYREAPKMIRELTPSSFTTIYQNK